MPNQGKGLSDDQRRYLLDQFLKCIDREETLIHYRLSWGMQYNIASFAALFALQQLSSIDERSKSIIYIIIAVFGASATGLSMIGIGAAHHQAEFLIKSLNKRLNIPNEDWDDTEFIRPFGEPSKIHRQARWVSKFLPLLFVVLWVTVFFWSYPNVVSRFH